MGLIDGLLNPVSDALFGNADQQNAQAQDALDRALAQYTDLQTPQLQTINLNQVAPSQQYIPTKQAAPNVLQSYPELSFGKVDPKLYQALTQSGTNFNDISLDPKYQNAQDQSLSALQDIISGGGLNSQDKANLAQIQSQIASQDRGRREAILQGMHARGMGGSGLELLAQLQSAQDASTRQSQQDMDVAAQSQARQLDAILKSGQMGQSMMGQQYGQKADVAKAQDIINQFNTTNQNEAARSNAGVLNSTGLANAQNQYVAQSGNRAASLDSNKFNIGNQANVMAANTGAANQAGMYNASAAQDLAKSNTGISNQQTMYNANLPQQEFNNQMSVASGVAGQEGNQAANAQRQAEDKNRQIASYIDAGLKGASILASRK